MAKLTCIHIRAQIGASTNLTGEYPSMDRPRARIADAEKDKKRSNNLSRFSDFSKQLQHEFDVSPSFSMPLGFRMHELRFQTALAIRENVGNCGEMSAAALIFLSGINLFPLDLLSVFYKSSVTFGHAFLVIGREKGTTLAEPWKWGENAVVCDPWNNLVFPVSAYHYYALHIPHSFRHLMVSQIVRLESATDEFKHSNRYPEAAAVVKWDGDQPPSSHL